MLDPPVIEKNEIYVTIKKPWRWNMPFEVLEKKIAQIPAQYQQELMDFIDFLLTKPETPKNGLDLAIEELKNGEYDTYSSFDDFLSEVEHES